MLTKLNGDFYEPMTELEFQQFKKENPDFAKYFESE